MSRQIDHINAIGCEKPQVVLYIESQPCPYRQGRKYERRDNCVRATVHAWRNTYGVPRTSRGPFADPQVRSRYLGHVDIDAPYHEALPEYWVFGDYLEYADGTERHRKVRFHPVPLDHARGHVVHDEPGFWERWAEDF